MIITYVIFVFFCITRSAIINMFRRVYKSYTAPIVDCMPNRPHNLIEPSNYQTNEINQSHSELIDRFQLGTVLITINI